VISVFYELSAFKFETDMNSLFSTFSIKLPIEEEGDRTCAGGYGWALKMIKMIKSCNK